MSTNQAQKKERIHEIYRLLLTGTSRRSIIRYASIKQWGVSDRTIDGYIKEAMEELTTALSVDREKKAAIAQNRLEDLYNRSYTINDFKTCLAVLKESNELNGLKKDNVEHTVILSDIDILRSKLDAALQENPDNRQKLIQALQEEP